MRTQRFPRKPRQSLISLLVTALMIGATGLALMPATADAATPSGTAYVANFGSNSVTPITVATNTPGAPITVGTGPDGIAIAPGSVQLPSEALGGLLLTGLVAVAFAGYQLIHRSARRTAAVIS